MCRVRCFFLLFDELQNFVHVENLIYLLARKPRKTSIKHQKDSLKYFT